MPGEQADVALTRHISLLDKLFQGCQESVKIM